MRGGEGGEVMKVVAAMNRPKRRIGAPKRRMGSGYGSGIDRRGGARTGILSRISRPGSMRRRPKVGGMKRPKIGGMKRPKLGSRRSY